MSIIKKIGLSLIVLTLAIYVGYLASPYLFTIVQSDGMSMSPSTVDKDKSLVFTTKRPANILIERGMSAIFEIPSEDSGVKEYIGKRVIGLPGDQIRLQEGKLFINDIEVAEPYVKFNGSISAVLVANVPEGYLFVMGDNRQVSADSRNTTYADPQVKKMPIFMLDVNSNDPISKDHFVSINQFVGLEIFNLTQFKLLGHQYKELEF